MKWALPLFSLYFIFYLFSCQNFEVKSSVSNTSLNNLLVTIGDKEITVNDFIKRCEYVPRPNYCKNNNYVHKKIALNSLIAEKLLALEFEKNNYNFTRAQKNLILGRKEQSMRQMMLKKNGFNKVKPDTNTIKVVSRQLQKTYDLAFLNVNEQQKKIITSSNYKSLREIKENIIDTLPIGSKKITFDEDMPMQIKEILYFTQPQKNILYGPILLSKTNFMFFEINGWNTLVSVTDDQKRQSFNDAQEAYNELNALKIYERYVLNLMRGKKIDFYPNVFQLFAGKLSKIYLIEKNKKESVMQNKMWDNEVEEVKGISSFDDLNDIQDLNLLSFDNKNFSVARVLNLIKTHPLVFRNRKVSQDSFENELKYALADLFRDLEITKRAYKLNYDQYEDIISIENKWKDYISSEVVKSKLAKNHIRNDVFKAICSKIDSLQQHYSGIIKIDTDKFEKIQLTSIDLNVIYTNQAYSQFEPSFPILTDDHLLDYGKKYNFN